jgi:thymidine phosphorylase
MDVWRRMIAAQGGDPDAPLPQARERETVIAETDGVVTEQDAKAIGVAAWRLGAGRARQGDPVQHGAGVLLHARRGDAVREGQPLATLLTDDTDRLPRALDAMRNAHRIEPAGTAVEPRPLVATRIAGR